MNNYEHKYLKYKIKYLELNKQLYGGNSSIDDLIQSLFNKLFGKKIEENPKEENLKEDSHDSHDSHIPHDSHDRHTRIIKKHTEIESETEGFEHGSH